jgi:hypothetical protein
MILLKFGNYRSSRRIKLKNGTVQFSEEEGYSGSATQKNGLYDVLNGQLIALFSDNGKNYLYAGNQLHELTPAVSVKCSVAQSSDEESWLTVYEQEIVIFQLSYITGRAPFVLPDPFFPDEDYETVNFGSKIVEYLKKSQENPEVVLFG